MMSLAAKAGRASEAETEAMNFTVFCLGFCLSFGLAQQLCISSRRLR